jgi:hypothetical protein
LTTNLARHYEAKSPRTDRFNGMVSLLPLMSGELELRAAKRRWREREVDEEISLYKFILEETPNSPSDGLYHYEDQRVLPKLAIAALQIRDHSRDLIRWTWALIVLTSVLAVLTAVLVAVSLKL